jgi:hypothetical protein
MKLEVGKTYLTREGNRVTLTENKSTDSSFNRAFPFREVMGVRSWTAEGRYLNDSEDGRDIIQEMVLQTLPGTVSADDLKLQTIDVDNPPLLTGIKHDDSKVRLDLLSPIWLNGVGKVLTFGCKKYSANNWRGGLAHSRTLGAALRHIFAFMSGEDNDPETGLLHLYHASCCLQFASELHETKQKLVDDRYKTSTNGTETGATDGI